jgi:hypothetical protein
MKKVFLTKIGHRPPPLPPLTPTATTAAALFGAPPQIFGYYCIIAVLMCEVPPKRWRHLTHRTMVFCGTSHIAPR